MIDLDEFRELFEPIDPAATVKKVFATPGWEPKATVVKWKGKSTTVYDFEFFKMLIQDWIKRDKITKEEALDNFFEMFDT